MNRFSPFLIFILSIISTGQGFSQEKSKNSLCLKQIHSAQIPAYIDSIKIAMFNDTCRFSKNDLVYSARGYSNIKGYSPLFIINEKFFYKLDVIDADQVSEFIYKCLDTSKIEDILFLNSASGSAIYGSPGSNGVIMITLRHNADFNPEVAGLKIKGDKIRNNFSERRNEDILIRH
jgi:TonB-dependent SusC/RagA subfamily outer membrane receptor